MLKTYVKKFGELSPHKLYAILKLRSEVFAVEQRCIYQDLDDKDQCALHVLGMKEGKLVAYTRIFKAGDYFKEASIGRVVVQDTERAHGFGKEIMKASIAAIQDHFHDTIIHLSAQLYLQNFYTTLGFESRGETYLEDGIPHIAMVKKD